MAGSFRKTVYQAVPVRNPGVRPLLWLILGFSLLTLLGSGWTLVLLSGRVASHHNFVGHLSPDADPIVVSLPHGAILKELHTTRNAKIRQGQTVATLDIDAMEQRIEMLGAELLHDDLLRECLLIEEPPDAAYFVDLPEQAREHARLARQDCRGFLAEKARIMERLAQKQNLMREEQSLVTRYQGLLSYGLNGSLPPQQREQDARQALALALLRNKLEQQLAEAQFDADKEGAEWQQRRLKQVRALMKAIRLKTELRRHMRALLERPRLHAPENGFVVQVRSIPRDTAMKEDIDLIVLRPEDGVGYRASFEVPHHQLDSVSTGDKVQMTMLGMINGGPLLTGSVSGLRSTGHTLVRAEVTLDQESVTKLDDPQIGVALRGLGTASIIRVQKADQPVLPLLKTVASGLLQPGERWFLPNLLSPSQPSQRPVMTRG